jgi:antitoxin VapB
MSLNINNEKTFHLIRELTRLTGESMTAAVEQAVQGRFERVREKDVKGNAERLMKIAWECAPLWKEPYKSIDHGDLLYDEKGLPK